jgi:hypothetical protein
MIMLLTDDQDVVLGGDGAGAMPAGLPALSRRGATLHNWFVSTPVCAVSRSAILTGKLFHNLVDQPEPGDPWDRRGNTRGPCFAARPGPGCGGPETAPGRNMHLNFSKLSPGPTFASHLSSAGYTVAIFGKYLNRNPMRPDGLPAIPAGVDKWFVAPGDEANKATEQDSSGEYFPSFYYDGDAEGMMWNNSHGEYETAFLGNHSLTWINQVRALRVCTLQSPLPDAFQVYPPLRARHVTLRTAVVVAGCAARESEAVFPLPGTALPTRPSSTRTVVHPPPCQFHRTSHPLVELLRIGPSLADRPAAAPGHGRSHHTGSALSSALAVSPPDGRADFGAGCGVAEARAVGEHLRVLQLRPRM